MKTKSIKFTTKWPVNKTGDREFEVVVPTGEGTPILNIKFVEMMRLTENEESMAEDAVLRQVAINK